MSTRVNHVYIDLAPKEAQDFTMINVNYIESVRRVGDDVTLVMASGTQHSISWDEWCEVPQGTALPRFC